MANEAAKKLIEDMMKEPELFDRMTNAGNINDAVKAARELGYDVTEQELAAAENDARKTFAAASDTAAGKVKLSIEKTDTVAGGGEDAADGHEMGCFIAWHGRGYEEDCRQDYYCHAGYNIPKCHGPYNHR